MAFTVYDGIFAYSKRANSGLYLSCRTSIFNNPDNQIYTPKGKKTLVRQYNAGKAGNYDKNKGWLQTYGNGTGIEWKEYEAPFDRAKVLKVDAMDELQSFGVGMTPSIDLLNDDFFNNQLPGEIDAANIAQFYSRIPDANKHGSDETDYGTDVDSILNTILTLGNNVFNSGYAGKTVLFVRSAVYKNLQQAIIKNYGLASGVLLKNTMTVNIDSEFGKLLSDGDDTISVQVEIEEFDKFFIIQMPDDRMYNLITMLDGVSVGQEDGGYVPDSDDPDFALVDLIAIPYDSAFTNIRHSIDNFLVPGSLQDFDYSSIELFNTNKRMFKNIQVNNAGINQKANAFEYDIRVIYGGDIYDNRRRNCFAVLHTDNSKTYTNLTIGAPDNIVVDTPAQLTVTGTYADGQDDVTDKCSYAVVDGTGAATVTSAGVVTPTAAGTFTVVVVGPNGLTAQKALTATSAG